MESSIVRAAVHLDQACKSVRESGWGEGGESEGKVLPVNVLP